MMKTPCIVIALLLVGAAAWGEPFNATGFLHQNDGLVTEFESMEINYANLNDRPVLYLKRSQTSGRIEVDLGIVREIIFLESPDGTTYWSQNSRVHVTLKNGQESEFLLADRVYDFRISLFDSFTQSEQQTTVDDGATARIVFGDDFGNVRINPDTGKIWPPSYRFDPYTGRELQWFQNETSLKWGGEAQAVVARYELQATDVSVPGFYRVPTATPGDDAPSDEELNTAVRDYVRAWANPFSGSEQISDSLQRLRDQVLGD